jgi:hypothetical protein
MSTTSCSKAEQVVLRCGDAPAQRRDFRLAYARFDRGPGTGRGVGFARQKDAERCEVVSGRAQVDQGQFAHEQPARCFAQDAGPVAGPAVGRTSAAMLHGRRSLERQFDRAVAGRPAQVSDEADACGVVFLGRRRRARHRDLYVRRMHGHRHWTFVERHVRHRPMRENLVSPTLRVEDN